MNDPNSSLGARRGVGVEQLDLKTGTSHANACSARRAPAHGTARIRPSRLYRAREGKWYDLDPGTGTVLGPSDDQGPRARAGKE
jgi:hypothetical protein